MQLLRGQSFVDNNHRDCGAANRNVIVTATAKARKTLQDDERAVAGAVHDHDEGKRWGCRCPNPPPRQIKLAEKLTNAQFALPNPAISRKNP